METITADPVVDNDENELQVAMQNLYDAIETMDRFYADRAFVMQFGNTESYAQDKRNLTKDIEDQNKKITDLDQAITETTFIHRGYRQKLMDQKAECHKKINQLKAQIDQLDDLLPHIKKAQEFLFGKDELKLKHAVDEANHEVQRLISAQSQ